MHLNRERALSRRHQGRVAVNALAASKQAAADVALHEGQSPMLRMRGTTFSTGLMDT